MKRLLAPALVLLVAVAGDALAQTTTRENPATRRNAGAQPANRTSQATAGENSLAQHIAACLLLGNQEEIAISQLGVQHAQNDQVKQFAQKMIEQHQQAISQLQQAAPELASMNLQLSGTHAADNQRGAAAQSADASSATTAIESQPAGGENQRTATTGQAGSSEAGNVPQMVQFIKQVKEQCVQLVTQDLSQKQGAEFDKCFMGVQNGLHTGMLAKLRAAKQHVSGGPLEQVVEQGTQMTEHHLAEAKQIMQQLEGASGETPRAAAGARTTRQ
ncbi:MAG: DUF4142 domain-containing protein [Pirellulales bacterium]|nr:DUF4142 domain-containing protein [Pirellulales bacterium]